MLFFFFSSRRRHTRFKCDWSSDVCSSDLSKYGDLTIDNKSQGGQPTVFPSLGSGVALTGSSGATLVTDRTVDIPAYFAGHWIEISDSTGTLKGSWRVASIPSARPVTLAVNATETISVNPGDKWQGVYHFDTFRGVNNTTYTSNDPIRI